MAVGSFLFLKEQIKGIIIIKSTGSVTTISQVVRKFHYYSSFVALHQQ